MKASRQTCGSVHRPPIAITRLVGHTPGRRAGGALRYAHHSRRRPTHEVSFSRYLYRHLWAIGEGLNARSTTFEVERARPHTAILPLAAVEAHGPHLPVGCDTLVVESIARRAAALLGPGTYLLPTIPFGSSKKSGR
jgi:hypothetical protein